MNYNPMIKKIKLLAPWLAAILFFAALSFVYFSPVLKGWALPQMDNTHSIGMAKELMNHEKATGEKAQWTNSMFGGMPAFQIRGDSSANLFSYVNKITRLGFPYYTVAIVFLYLLGFLDRKSTRLNSSHVRISYAVFCLKKKTNAIT